MKGLRIACLVVFLLSVSTTSWAHSWDEPWHHEVVKRAATFVKAKAIKVSGSEAHFSLLKNLAGVKVPATFTVTGLSHQHLNVAPGDVVYLFLAQPEDEDAKPSEDAKSQHAPGSVFALITSTASVAQVLPDGVVAVYRHSYHAALVSPELYEWTQRAIFRRSLLGPWDEERVRKYVRTELAKPPAKLETHTDSDFFRQHVALELLFHQDGAGLENQEILKLVEPFLGDSGLHPQISAARALGAVAGEASSERLLRFVESPDREGFAKVMALWALQKRRTKSVQKRLEDYQSAAETEELGFGGNIMDPRIGTYFPGSVKAALDRLLEDWGPLSTAPERRPSTKANPEEPEATRATAPEVQPASPTLSPKKSGCASCSSGGGASSAPLAWFLVLLLCLYRRPRHSP